MHLAQTLVPLCGIEVSHGRRVDISHRPWCRIVVVAASSSGASRAVLIAGWLTLLAGIGHEPAEQSCHDDRKIELPCNGLHPRKGTGDGRDGADIAVAHSRQCHEAIIDEEVRLRLAVSIA